MRREEGRESGLEVLLPWCEVKTQELGVGSNRTLSKVPAKYLIY